MYVLVNNKCHKVKKDSNGDFYYKKKGERVYTDSKIYKTKPKKYKYVYINGKFRKVKTEISENGDEVIYFKISGFRINTALPYIEVYDRSEISMRKYSNILKKFGYKN
jgi:hypothetical protein